MMNKHPLADCEHCPLQASAFVPSKIPAGPVTHAIIGEAPGQQEKIWGEPFVGPSGQLLKELLKRSEIDAETCLLTNAVLCRPANNTDPPPDAITACRPRLLGEIERGRPQSILTVGGIAAKSLFNTRDGILKFRVGPPRQFKVGDTTVPAVATVHPAAVLRSADYFPFLVTDIQKLTRAPQEWVPPKYKVADTERKALRYIEFLSRFGRLVVDVECVVEKDVAYEHPSDKDLLCVGIAYDSAHAIVFTGDTLRSNRVGRRFGQLLRRTHLVAQNGKFDVPILRVFDQGIRLDGDTMLAHYCLDERGGIHGLKVMAREYLGAPDYAASIKKYTSAGRSFGNIPPDILYEYNAYDCTLTYALHELFQPRIEAEGLTKLYRFMVRASNALMIVERDGVTVDTERLNDLEAEYAILLIELEAGLAAYVENPRSPKQVTAALAGLGVVTASTDKNHLKDIRKAIEPYRAQDHPQAVKVADFIDRLAVYRKERLLYGTYILGIKRRLDATNRVHTTYKQHATVSGRLSSANPGLQNQPRLPKWRRIYIPTEPDSVFVQADFAQGETRIVTALANEPYFLQKFQAGDDVIAEVQAQLFPGDTTKETRVKVKNILYGCVPLATEILTQEGWKTHDKVRVGDKTLGYNPTTKQQEWTEIKRIFHYQDADILTMKTNKNWKVTATPNHRWPALMRRFDRTKPELFKFYTTETVPKDCKLILSAPAKTSADTDLTPNEVAIIAWIHTDGHMRISPFTGAPSQGIEGQRQQLFAAITQSKPQYVKVLDELLRDVPHARDISALLPGQRNPCIVYRLRSSWLRNLWTRARLWDGQLEDFVLNLSPEQREAFLEAAFQAEGHLSDNPKQTRIIGQNLGEVRNAIKLAAFLSGYYVRSNKEVSLSGKIHDRMRLGQPTITGQRLIRTQAGKSDVWCVETGLGSWTMRQDDQIMLTGNSWYGMIMGKGDQGVDYAKFIFPELSVSAACARAFAYQQQVFDLVPNIIRWQQATRAKVKRGETLQTFMGRRRRFWYIGPANERDVMNECLAFVPQGTLTDMCLLGLCELVENGHKVRLTVHDSIVVECKKDKQEETSNVLTETLERAARQFTDTLPEDQRLPFPVECSFGNSWGDC